MPAKIVSKRDVSPHKKWMRVEQWHLAFPNGTEIKDYFVRFAPECVIIVAKAPDGRVIVLDEYVIALGRRMFKFPAGYLEEGESPREAVVRELREETGFVAKKFEEVAVSYPSPETTVKPIHVFVVTETAAGKSSPEPTEDLVVKLMTPQEVDEIGSAGGIESSDMAAAWLAARKRFV